jgi:hypothetical protein
VNMENEEKMKKGEPEKDVEEEDSHERQPLEGPRTPKSTSRVSSWPQPMLVQVIRGFDGMLVETITFAPDSRWLAVGTWNGRLHVFATPPLVYPGAPWTSLANIQFDWHEQYVTKMRTLRKPTPSGLPFIGKISATADGQRILVALEDHSVRVVHLETIRDAPGPDMQERMGYYTNNASSKMDQSRQSPHYHSQHQKTTKRSLYTVNRASCVRSKRIQESLQDQDRDPHRPLVGVSTTRTLHHLGGGYGRYPFKKI